MEGQGKFRSQQSTWTETIDAFSSAAMFPKMKPYLGAVGGFRKKVPLGSVSGLFSIWL